MDGVLNKLLSFPPHPPPPSSLTDQNYDEGIKEQINAVQKIPNLVLLQEKFGGEHALDVINPGVNTVPYTYILLANLTAVSNRTKGADINKILEKMTNYLQHFDPRQIRYLGNEFRSIVESYLNYAASFNYSAMAVDIVSKALLRLDPAGTVLTSSHLKVIKLVLENRCYDAFSPFRDNIILYIPDSNDLPNPKYPCSLNLNPASYISTSSGLTTKLTHVSILEYFLYSGMACLGARKWENALKFFECAITYPAKDAVSKLMVEAYKKWVLTSLLHRGKVPELPKTIAASTTRVFHVLAKPYECLAFTFENDTASELKSEAEAALDIWLKDCNKGLVLQVLASYQKFQIRNLAAIYSKISIPEVHEKTYSAETGEKLSSVSEVERLVLEMINQGELDATLSSSTQGPSILTFSLTGPIMTEAQIQKELATSLSRIRYITQGIKFTDRHLTHDDEYIKYLQRQKKKAKQGQTDGSQSESAMNWNDVVEDEDIMGVY
ncbi:hypothetical protein K3495_g4428 [Podosphaera aphanis]|nr:hypothetical protein K3495_g4428 [Podosphaera aphanis]